MTRRSLFKGEPGAAAAASIFTVVKAEQVRGIGSAMLKVGIPGVGMRGSQAVLDTRTGNGNVQLAARGPARR